MMLRWIIDIDEMLARVTIGCMHADAEERVSTFKGLNTSNNPSLPPNICNEGSSNVWR